MELQIRGVSKTYANGVRALDDVSLTIPPGLYGLLGFQLLPARNASRIPVATRDPSASSRERMI